MGKVRVGIWRRKEKRKRGYVYMEVKYCIQVMIPVSSSNVNHTFCAVGVSSFDTVSCFVHIFACVCVCVCVCVCNTVGPYSAIPD